MGFFAGDGAWLFPLSYLAHILEEWLVGGRFYFWVPRLTGRTMSRRAFTLLNGVLLLLMLAAVLLVRSRQSLWLVPALGVITATNGMGHLAGVAATRSYSPGFVTGVFIWIPLGSFAVLGSTIWLTPGTWWLGIVAGLLLSGLVFALGFGSSRRIEYGEDVE